MNSSFYYIWAAYTLRTFYVYVCIEHKGNKCKMFARIYRWNLLTVGERLGGGGAIVCRSISGRVGGWTRRRTAGCDTTECRPVRAQIRRRLCCCKQTSTMRLSNHMRNDHISIFEQHIFFLVFIGH